jgi:hypothetical protein
MSRFLHGIVAIAQSPSVSVHPVVPSLFSSPALHDGPEDTQRAATETLHGRDGRVAPTAERSASDPTARGPAAAAIGEESSDAARNRVDAQSEQTERLVTQSIAPFSNVWGNRARNFASAADAQSEQTERPLTQPTTPFSNISDDRRARNFASAADRFERTAPAAAIGEGSSDAARNRLDARSGQTRGLLAQSIGPFSNVLDGRARNLASAADRYSPHTPEGSPRTSNPQALEPLMPRAMTPTMQRADETDHSGRLARHLRSQSREADEIQIHIGRIEVTAVPPAPARPAPVPNRKSPSLDDYLKRRPGRAG